jgi:hypothetical protein
MLARASLPRATLAVYPWARPTRNDLLERLQPQMIVFSEGARTKRKKASRNGAWARRNCCTKRYMATSS